MKSETKLMNKNKNEKKKEKIEIKLFLFYLKQKIHTKHTNFSFNIKN